MTLSNILKTALLSTLTIGACSAMDHGTTPTAISAVDTSIGTVFANDHGMTLYTFSKDKQGKSNCNGGCADNWPPLVASMYAEEEGDFSIISRDDGTQQWAYQDSPLYLWVADKKQGDVTGHKIGNVWFAATLD